MQNMMNLSTILSTCDMEINVRNYCTSLYHYTSVLDWIWAPIVITYYLSLIALKKAERLAAEANMTEGKATLFGITLGKYQAIAFLNAAHFCLVTLTELAPFLLMMTGVFRLVILIWAW